MERIRDSSELLALSFDAQASPTLSLRGQSENQPGLLPLSWGVAWYPDDQRSATVLKEPDLPQGVALGGFLEEWGQARSGQFVAHTRSESLAGQGDTLPLVRSYAGRHWVFASAGELSPDLSSQLPLGDAFDIAPIGSTMAEHAFSWLLARIRERGAKTIDQFGWIELRELLLVVNEFGPTSFVLSDGIDLVAYRDHHDVMPLHWTRVTPPHDEPNLDGHAFRLRFDGPLDSARTLLAISTFPMRGSPWIPLEAGEMRVVRRGASVWSTHPADIDEQAFKLLGAPNPDARGAAVVGGAQQQQQAASSPLPSPAPRRAPDEAILSVVHETIYRYQSPVERSTHRFCLRPVQDDRQQVLEHSLSISVDGLNRDFEDVFGNRATVLEVSQPFAEMHITSHSRLRVVGVTPSELKSPLRRDQIPLAWMPWQRQMMQAYLMPPELPESQLMELSDFAMSFVERNDHDLVETLLDLNRTIYRDFTYVTGSTTVETTPFQVYQERKGVCQDFANVLICVARLLGVPSRYRVGYIYTGGSYENKIQSDASHAWAEAYLPWTGWFGFDPTNGCLASADHVRIACGRQFRDAAPTTGTIYRGGGGESLEIGVRVEREEL